MKCLPAIIVLLLIFSAFGLEIQSDIKGIPKKLNSLIENKIGDGESQKESKARQILDSLGFFEAQFVVTKTSDHILINGTGGDRYTYDSIYITGQKAVQSEEIIEIISLSRGKPFNAGGINSGIERVLRHYEDNGYPFCRMFVKDIKKHEGRATLVFEMEEGKLYYVGNLHVSGNTLTKPHVVMRALPLKRGDIFSQAKINGAQKKLAELEVFEGIDEPELKLHPRRRLVDIGFKVREGKTVFAEGVAGYSPEAADDSPWIGSGSIEAKNILGTGRRGLISFYKEPRVSTFDLKYKEPWLLGKRTDGSVSLNMEIRAEAFSSLVADLNLSFRVVDRWNLLFILTRNELSDIIENISVLSYGTGTGIERSGFDFLPNPKKGWGFCSTVTLSSKNKNGQRFREWSSSNSAETAHSLKRRVVLFLGAYVRNISSPQKALTQGERIRIGGATTIRGYRYGHFAVNQAGWVRTEFRLLPDIYSRLYVFADAGMVAWNEEDNNNKFIKRDDRLASYGIGFSLPTRIGTMGFDLAVARGERLKNAQVHAKLRSGL